MMQGTQIEPKGTFPRDIQVSGDIGTWGGRGGLSTVRERDSSSGVGTNVPGHKNRDKGHFSGTVHVPAVAGSGGGEAESERCESRARAFADDESGDCEALSDEEAWEFGFIVSMGLLLWALVPCWAAA